MNWGKALGWAAAGALVVVGVEVVAGVAVINKIGLTKKIASANGYTIRLTTIPAIVGYEQPVGVSLSYNGQAASNQALSITVQRDSGTETAQVTTDKNGVALFSLLSFNPQTVHVTASYSQAGTVVVSDVMDITFKASTTVGG